MRVVQRLDSKAVARHEQACIAPIPYCKGKHAEEALHALRAPGVIGLQDDFAVALGEEPIAHRNELGAQLLIVVDRAVEDQYQLQFLVDHGLVAISAEVNDRQAAVAKSQRAFAENSRVVWTAPGDPVGHAFDR